MNSELDFQPYQMVCLENGGDRLYAEVIQVVRSRHMAWVRPLMLVKSSQTLAEESSAILYDLRQGADLLWPVSGFRVALDIEVIPLLTELKMPQTELSASPIASKQLRNFIEQVWEARHPN